MNTEIDSFLVIELAKKVYNFVNPVYTFSDTTLENKLIVETFSELYINAVSEGTASVAKVFECIQLNERELSVIDNLLQLRGHTERFTTYSQEEDLLFIKGNAGFATLTWTRLAGHDVGEVIAENESTWMRQFTAEDRAAVTQVFGLDTNPKTKDLDFVKPDPRLDDSNFL